MERRNLDEGPYIRERRLNAVTGRRVQLLRCGVHPCTASFTKLSNLREHLNQHTGRRPYSCNICRIAFKQRGQLLKHYTTKTHMRSAESHAVNESAQAANAQVTEFDQSFEIGHLDSLNTRPVTARNEADNLAALTESLSLEGSL